MQKVHRESAQLPTWMSTVATTTPEWHRQLNDKCKLVEVKFAYIKIDARWMDQLLWVHEASAWKMSPNSFTQRMKGICRQLMLFRIQNGSSLKLLFNSSSHWLAMEAERKTTLNLVIEHIYTMHKELNINHNNCRFDGPSRFSYIFWFYEGQPRVQHKKPSPFIIRNISSLK